MWISCCFFSQRCGGTIDESMLRQIKIFITANTSTSYVECDNLPIVELIEFFESLIEYLKKVNTPKQS